MRTRRVGFVLAMTVALVAAMAAPAAAVNLTWNPAPTQSIGYGAELTAVSADALSDAWAVGQWFDQPTSTYKSLAEHWDGTAWTIKSTVNPMNNQQLNGVAALSPSNAWAVGFTNANTWLDNRTLVEHWNGTAWSRVPSPNPTSVQNELWGAWAAAPNDVWAVGDQGTSGGGQKTLIERWNGTSWAVVASPDATSYNNLHRVGGSGPKDVWAVGTAYNSATDVTAPLVEHWNGTRWTIVASPVLGPSSYLRGVSATSATDAWIVGEWDSPAPSYTPHPLVLHWNGTKWSAVTSPTSGAFTLSGVAAKTTSDAWIVGDTLDYTTNNYKTLIEHWNGTGWSVVASPNPDASYDSLDAVTVLPGGIAWATGTAGSGPLALRNPDG